MTTLLCNCGCGYKCDSVVEAEQHSIATGHTLTVQGVIKTK
jgi:hypothetical protein